MCSRVAPERFAQVGAQRSVRRIERRVIRVVDQDAVVGGRIGAPCMHRSFGLHGAFQAALNLDRFELSLKKAGSRTFEQSLEEPLDRGEGTSHRVGESTSRGGSGLDFTHGADAHQYLPTWTIARSYRYWSKGSLWPKVPAHCADMVGF